MRRGTASGWWPAIGFGVVMLLWLLAGAGLRLVSGPAGNDGQDDGLRAAFRGDAGATMLGLRRVRQADGCRDPVDRALFQAVAACARPAAEGSADAGSNRGATRARSAEAG
jgi:hypothetical protein